MRVECVVLENHGDIAVFWRYIVHQLTVNIELSAGDLLQSGHHTKCGGFAAPGRADQNDKFLVRDIQAEFLYRYYAFIRNLQIILLFWRIFLLFPCTAGMGIDFFDIHQTDLCHRYFLLIFSRRHAALHPIFHRTRVRRLFFATDYSAF